MTAALDPVHRPARIRLQKACVVLALLAFMVSLALPAVTVPAGDPEGWDVRVSGLTCAVMSEAHYPSNLLLLTAPLTAWLLRRRRGPALPLAAATLAVCSLAFVAATPLFDLPAERTVFGREVVPGAGFALWVTAHLLVTVALSVPVWGTDAERERLTREFESLQRRWAPAPRAMQS